MTVKPKIPMTPSKRHQKDLIEQKYIDLTTTYERMKLKPDVTSKFTDIVAIIEGLIAPDVEHSWDNANIIEQSLAFGYIHLGDEIVSMILIKSTLRPSQ